MSDINIITIVMKNKVYKKARTGKKYRVTLVTPNQIEYENIISNENKFYCTHDYFKKHFIEAHIDE